MLVYRICIIHPIAGLFSHSLSPAAVAASTLMFFCDECCWFCVCVCECCCCMCYVLLHNCTFEITLVTEYLNGFALLSPQIHLLLVVETFFFSLSLLDDRRTDRRTGQIDGRTMLLLSIFISDVLFCCLLNL